MNIQEEINLLVDKINTQGKQFIQSYFDSLNNARLTNEEELEIIEFAINTISADDQIEYSEIKFFKNIRHRLQLTDDMILNKFPDIDLYLEDDIITDGFLDKITNQYFQSTELPQFEMIETKKDE